MTSNAAHPVSVNAQRVGFIGLGDQGAPIAEMIARGGFALDVWARRADAVAPLVALGARAASSPAELGAACDVVGLCVVDDAAVDDVVFEQGLLAGMRPGSVLIIHSTVAPSTCRQIGDVAAARSIGVLDAPVSGGRNGALNRSLTVMAGGDPAILERVRPVLETYGDPIRLLGPLGAGQVAKLVNNGLFVANVGLAAAALDLGAELGVDREVLSELLAASSATSAGLKVLPALEGTDWGRHAWTVLRKDVSLLAAVVDAQDPVVTVAADAVTRFSGPDRLPADEL